MDKEPLLKVDKIQRESTRKSIQENDEKSQNREEFLNFNMVPNTLANRNRRAKSRSPTSNSPSLKSGRSVK